MSGGEKDGCDKGGWSLSMLRGACGGGGAAAAAAAIAPNFHHAQHLVSPGPQHRSLREAHYSDTSQGPGCLASSARGRRQTRRKEGMRGIRPVAYNCTSERASQGLLVTLFTGVIHTSGMGIERIMARVAHHDFFPSVVCVSSSSALVLQTPCSSYEMHSSWANETWFPDFLPGYSFVSS